LERERLARQKRLRGDVNASTSVEDSEDEDNGAPPAKRHAPEFPPSSKRLVHVNPALASASSSASARLSTNATEKESLFWEGELRQTANPHVDPKKDTRPTFRLSEILGKVCMKLGLVIEFIR
jgi:tyrosyl-DNA phosphodiesterase 1